MLIPSNYWNGRNTLDLEYPWLVPEAISVLESILKKDMKVLEFGTGGSSIFFARRCASVLGYESNYEWMEKVKAAIKEKGLDNIEIRTLGEQPEGIFDVILIDSDPTLTSRPSCCSKAIQCMKEETIVIVDNYAEIYCDGIEELLTAQGLSAVAYNDLHWQGAGTKIWRKK